MSEFRVFLSAVTSEFGQARDSLAKDLAARDTLVRVQDSFRAEATADTLLRLLHDYVRNCSAVVCVLGTRGGMCPPPMAVTPAFKAMVPDGITEATYTQWEFYFARKYQRRLSLYRARDDYAPERDRPSDGDRPDLQAAFLRQINEAGLHWIGFSSRHELRAEVLKEDWLREKPPKPVVLPYQSLGLLFKGRDGFMRRLRTSLTRADDGKAAIAGTALCGLGGVGKTRAAVEYAWTHRDDYNALALLDAETPEKLQSSLAALVGPLRLSAQAAPEEAVRLEAALDWLNTNPGWFLIFDNIDSEPALIAAHRLLGRLAGGHVVMTSRLARFPLGVDRLDLDVLTLDDATDFLLAATANRRQAADDVAQARTLAKSLGQLALALEMAAATIEARAQTIAGYQALWQGNRKRVVGWARSEITGYHHAVAETWQTSVDQLTAEGRTLLERLAFLAPEPVPVSLLDVKLPGVGDDEDAHAALDDLATYSLANRDAGGETFLLHRLVLDVTRRGLTVAGTVKPRLTEALGWINAAFVGDTQDVRTWPVLDPLTPHVEALVEYADAASIVEPTSRLMGQLGMLFHAKSLHARAEIYSRRALSIEEASYGQDHPNVARDLNNLAQLLKATNRLGEAEPLMRRALDIDEASYGQDHPSVATNLNNLALLLQATDRLAEAEPLMRRALGIDETSYGQDHPTVARDLNNLAALLQATNRPGEAEPLMRRALSIDEASYGQDHPNVARDLNNLATLLQATDRLGEAEPLMRRALSIDEASYGQDHPDVAIGFNNLAQLLQATNRLGEAEPLMRRALGINEASYGQDHPTVARDLNNLALLLQATNRLGEAEPLMRRALGIDEASYGQDHPTVARDLNNLAQLLQATNRLGEAEPLMRRALGIDEASYGQDHPDVARDLNNLAQLLQATNRLGEAEPLMRRALGIDEASYGQDHPTVARDLNNLAQLLQATNRLGEAEPLMRRALFIDEASYGQDHPNVARDLNNLAQLLQATNRLGEAEPLMRRALGIDEASYGQDHPTVARDLNNLALLLQATNRLGEAEPLMRRALGIDEASYGQDHPNVAIHLNNLSLLLQATNPLGEAEPLMRRALGINEASYGQDHPNVAIHLNNLAHLLQATNRLDEAEPLMRRALGIDEASYGQDHPTVATDLNNLALLLKATNRAGEAEPLMRRTLAIFLAFQRDTGHSHPHQDSTINNYVALLSVKGASESEVDAALQSLSREVGLDPG